MTSDWPPMVPRDATPEEALEFVLRWLDSRPPEEALIRSALTQMEPVIDWHWASVADELVELMRSRADIRLVVANSWFDDSVPDEVIERLKQAAESS